MLRTPRLVLMLLGILTGMNEVDAAFTTITASVDANLTDPTLSGNFTSASTYPPSSYGLVISRFEAPGSSLNNETRAVVEFNIAALGRNSTIQSLTFHFTPASYTSTTGQQVGIYGFAGTGAISLADATTSGFLLGSYDPTATQLNASSLTLSTATLQNLLAGSTGASYLTIRLQAISSYANTSIQGVENATPFPAPSIGVNYTVAPSAVPEPGSILLLGMGLITSVGVVRARSRAR